MKKVYLIFVKATKHTMKTKYDRAKELIEVLRTSKNVSQTELANAIGYLSPSNIAQIKRGKGFFKQPQLEALEKNFKVNLTWLLTGSGDMFNEDWQRANIVQEPTTSGTIFPALQKHGDRFAYIKDNMKILTVSVDVNNEEWVDVIPEHALAGYCEGYRDLNFFRQMPKETVPEDLRGRGTIRKFYVDGHSMEPTVHDGDWVYCSFMQITNYEEFKYKFRNGRMYVLNTATHGLILKRLYYHDGDTKIICESDNEDQKKYAPFHVELNDVKEFWYWRRTYTAKGARPPHKTEEISNMKYDIMETKYRLNSLTTTVDTISENISIIAKSLPTKDINK